MSEEEKKTNDEEKIIPNHEGYTIVKYDAGWVLFVTLFGAPMISLSILSFIRNVVTDKFWLFLLVYLGTCAIVWIIMRKITEVKVNLRITEDGLEQTRLSGSRFCPEYRMMEWGMMKRFHLYGGARVYEFKIDMREGRDFRISMPLLPIFEKQKKNLDSYNAFENDFLGIAPEHGVHRGFFY